MMKKILQAALLTTIGLTALGGISEARDTKHVFYDWGDRHWDTLDFKPYVTLYDRTHRPMNRYQAWPFSSDVAPNEAIEGLRSSQILHKFYIDEDTGHSVAEVGPYFYDLSQTDKGHFAGTIDRAYNVLDSDQRVLYLIDWNTKRHIGQYTPMGLMLF
jgi:hypothetical protein